MEKTVAIVTLYNPRLTVVENINKIAKYVNKIIIMDNSSYDNSKLFYKIKNAIYVAQYYNYGLSSAFNKACKLEIVRKSDFIIFFDQDSKIEENTIILLIEEYKKASKIEKIGCIGPYFFEKNRNDLFTKQKNAKKFYIEGQYVVDEIITSSMLTTYDNLKQINFWNESIFLDFADYELCWRLKKNGFKIILTENVSFNHSLGVGMVNLKLPIIRKKLSFSYSPPIREYYQTRDSIKLLRYKYVPYRWRKNLIFNITIRIFIFIFNLSEKKKRFTFYLKGIFDGFRNINGVI